MKEFQKWSSLLFTTVHVLDIAGRIIVGGKGILQNDVESASIA